MTLHHKHPPSSYSSYVHCACYQSTPVPPMEEAPDHPANIGTRVHAGIEAGIGGRPYSCPVEIINEEEQVMVARGVSYARALIADRSEESPAPLIEQRVGVVDTEFNEIVFGTCDLLLPPDPQGSCVPLITDWKSSRERGNHYEQMCCYALGAMQMFGTDAAEVHLRYVRFDDVDPDEDIWHIPYADAVSVVFGIHRDVTSENKQPTPHEDACRWCASKVTCPAINDMALQVASGYEPDLVESLRDRLGEFHPSKINDPEQMVLAKRIRDVLEKWCDSVQRHATKLAGELEDKGEALPGFKLIHPSDKEEIRRIVAAYKASGLPAEVFLECCDVSVSKLRAACAAEAGLAKSGAKPKKHLQKLMGGLMELTPKSPYLRKTSRKEK